MTRSEFAKIAVVLDNAFVGKDGFTETMEAAYFIVLERYNTEHIEDGIRKLVAKGQVFMPKPGEIVQAAGLVGRGYDERLIFQQNFTVFRDKHGHQKAVEFFDSDGSRAADYPKQLNQGV